MAYAHLEELKYLHSVAGTKECVTLEYFHDVLLQGVVFAVSDDEAYFVVEGEDQYHAIIGEIRGDSSSGTFWGTHFAVNRVESFTWRDQAILCVLNCAINDAGAADSRSERVQACAPYVTSWQ